MVRELRYSDLREMLRSGGKYPVDKASGEPQTVLDLLDNRFGQAKDEILDWVKQNFDVIYPEGYVINVFNDYLRFLDTPEWTEIIIFPPEVTSDFAYKPNLISKVVYGTTTLEFVIFALNDISYVSDLTADFISRKGVKILNREGIGKFKEIINYKKAEEGKKRNTFILKENR